MAQGEAPRPGGIDLVSVVAAVGGVLGVLFVLWFLSGSGTDLLALGGLAVFPIVVLVLSIAELWFAYGARTRKAWSLGPGLRAASFLLAVCLIGLMGLALYVYFGNVTY